MRKANLILMIGLYYLLLSTTTVQAAPDRGSTVEVAHTNAVERVILVEEVITNVVPHVKIEFVGFDGTLRHHGGLFRVKNDGREPVALTVDYQTINTPRPCIAYEEFHGHKTNGWFKRSAYGMKDRKDVRILNIPSGTQVVVRCNMSTTMFFPKGVDKWRLVINALGRGQKIVSQPFQFYPWTDK